jgi:hypothetical protein
MNGKLRLMAALMVGMFLAGCGMQPGDTLVKYEKGHDAITTTAPRDGTYSLYASDDVTPMVKYPLSKGDKIGFESNPDGTVTAVAGSNTQTIRTTTLSGTYYWKEEKGD